MDPSKHDISIIITYENILFHKLIKSDKIFLALFFSTLNYAQNQLENKIIHKMIIEYKRRSFL